MKKKKKSSIADIISNIIVGIIGIGLAIIFFLVFIKLFLWIWNI